MLTDLKARKLKADDKPVQVGGVAGLILHPGKVQGRGKYILRFVSPRTGKRRDMGLGSYPDIGLAEIRRIGMDLRAEIAAGIDPILRRAAEAERTIVAAVPTFEEAAEAVYASLRDGFRNAKHSAQWITTLRSFVFPHIGQRRVDELRVADFAEVLRPIWLSMPPTASRVQQRCERVMTWCVAQGYCQINPVASVRALLPRAPGKREQVEHHPAVPWRDLPEAFRIIRHSQRPSVARQALAFLILTAARSGEVRGATWSEIDLKRKVWTIPAPRMKGGVTHRVSLSSEAIKILTLRLAEREGDIIFPNSKGIALSDMALTKILRTAKLASDVEGRIATAHGFRSSFRDWASENGYPRDMAERALAHTIRNASEAAYHRTDLLEPRYAMMEAWCRYALGL